MNKRELKVFNYVAGIVLFFGFLLYFSNHSPKTQDGTVQLSIFQALIIIGLPILFVWAGNRYLINVKEGKFLYYQYYSNISDIANVTRYVVIDTETTGLDYKKDRVIEIALLKYDKGKLIGRYVSFINPKMKIPPEASAKNHITDNDVKNAPTYKMVCNDIADFINNEIVVGHNVAFDLNFITPIIKLSGKDVTVKYIDTLAISRALDKYVENHKLQTLVSYFGILTDGAHRAASDALATANVFEIHKKKV